MKIGILTFHRAQNYGAILQTYALQQFLRREGHEVEVIDYRPEYIEQSYSFIPINNYQTHTVGIWLKLFIRDLLLFPLRCIRRNKFRSFMKRNLMLSSKVNFNSIPSKYDVYIVGSDQVWNKEITVDYDDVFFCRFHFCKDNRKYISYAASLEPSTLTEADLSLLYDKLKQFDAISVRESSIINYLQIDYKGIYNVLDPTLLMDTHFWDRITEIPHSHNRYIVLYQARYNRALSCLVQQIANEMGCDVVEMSAWTLPISKIWRKGMAASPEEFLGFIKNAELVINTSFHGTVFSILYEVPFYYVLLSDGWDERSLSLLRDLDLMNRVVNVDYLKSQPIDCHCDFSKSKERLAILREKSYSFIRNNI